MNNITLTIEELSAIMAAGLSQISGDYLKESKTSYYGLSRDNTSKLIAKLGDAQPSFYLGAVNAGFLVGFSNMAKEFPFDQLWQNLNSSKTVSMLSDDTTVAGCAYRELRGFLLASNLISSEDENSENRISTGAN